MSFREDPTNPVTLSLEIRLLNPAPVYDAEVDAWIDPMLDAYLTERATREGISKAALIQRLLHADDLLGEQ